MLKWYEGNIEEEQCLGQAITHDAINNCSISYPVGGLRNNGWLSASCDYRLRRRRMSGWLVLLQLEIRECLTLILTARIILDEVH